MTHKLDKLTRDEVLAIIEHHEIFVELAKQLDDPMLERVFMYLIQLQKKPDMDAGAAAYALVELSAIAGEFGFAQVYYKTIGKAGTEERYRKDIYYTARDAVRHLVDSLKYIVRTKEAS